MTRVTYIEHSFYCMQCGNRGIPLMRKQGTQKEKFHRKKLYCPFCKEDVNHIECRNLEEVNHFLKNFNKCEYKEEAKESLSFVRGVRV